MANRNFSMIEYFNRRCAEIRPRLSFAGKSRADWRRWRRQLLGELKRLLGELPKPVPLRPEVVWQSQQDGLIQQRIVFDSEEHMSVPGLLYMPADRPPGQRLPAILCCHGHGPLGKDGPMGVHLHRQDRQANIRQSNYDYGLQMARHGYITFAVDWRVFGERRDGRDPYPGRDPCNVHFVRGQVLGINLLTLNIWDGMRAIDYLQSRPEVDPARIGCMGLSFGGTMTTWLSLLDERIRAADIICYADTFPRFGIARANFCGNQILPGLYRLCDVGDLAGLIAPRPLLMEIGLYDTCFLYEDAVVARNQARRIYRAAGAEDRFELDEFPGEHGFGGRKAFDFFDRWLRAEARRRAAASGSGPRRSGSKR
ncbi:MAG: alpha/beta hydrolase family protein [Phycisphaerae bacterium]